jgi:hypothetical protein
MRPSKGKVTPSMIAVRDILLKHGTAQQAVDIAYETGYDDATIRVALDAWGDKVERNKIRKEYAVGSGRRFRQVQTFTWKGEQPL